MRIIAGSLGGRVFESPHGHVTHPMSDKVRGGMFNALGDISGLTVLDAFAGSGALSFEALSRGASYAIAIDADKSAQRAIAENMKSLHLEDDMKLIRSSTNAWLNTSVPGKTYDLVLCDPPYTDLQLPLLNRLYEKVTCGGLLVLSWPGNQEVPTFAASEIVKQKSYGDAQLIFYRHP